MVLEIDRCRGIGPAWDLGAGPAQVVESTRALFSWGKFLVLGTIVLLFVFDNYCLIID
jgi:hypothetical protein